MAENAIQTEIQDLLTKYRAVLVRDRKHLVYQFPDGKIFVTAKTPSDRRAYLNQLSDLKHVLGIVSVLSSPVEPTERKKIYVPKNRNHKTALDLNPPVPLNLGLADKLRATGITENALREQIRVLEDQCCILFEEGTTTQAELTALRSTKAVRFVEWCKRRYNNVIDIINKIIEW